MSGWKLALPILAALTGLAALAEQKTNELSGVRMYRVYCASCHGIDGQGAGPAAPALKKAPPDLTRISARNKGQFPGYRIAHIIDGYEITAFHGSARDARLGRLFHRPRHS